MSGDVKVGVHVELAHPDDFLKIKETLTRIGVANQRDKKLYQSCHILHKKGEYYITHFKELFMLDGKPTDISEEDILRRNLVASLLSDWGLLKIRDSGSIVERSKPNAVKIVAYKEKNEWTLVQKYTIGNKH